MSNMVVRTNVRSLNSHRNLTMVGTQQARASARLSSGYRINSAADDAAGLGISEKMRSQIRGLNQASRNAQDGISLIQTAEGAMSTVNDMVTRIRELVLQAANDTNAHDGQNAATWSQSDRTKIQSEIDQLLLEIDATVNRTEFNTRKLLDGSLAKNVGSTGDTDDPTTPNIPDGPFTGDIQLAFAPGGITFDGSSGNNDVALGALAAGFSWVGTGTTSETAAKAGIDGMLATFLAATDDGTSSSYASLDAWVADINNIGSINSLSDLMSADTSAITNTVEREAVEAAQTQIWNAINAFDFSALIEFTNPASSTAIEIPAINGNPFTGNTAGGITLNEGFKFADGEDATSLATAINTLLTAAFDAEGTGGSGGTITDWFDSFETTGGPQRPTSSSADGEIANLQALFAADPTDYSNTDEAAWVTAAQAALQGILNNALDGIVEPDEQNNGGGGGPTNLRPGLWFQVGANRDQGVNLTIADVGVASLNAVGMAAGTGAGGIPTATGRDYSFLGLWSGGKATTGTNVGMEVVQATGVDGTQFDRTILKIGAESVDYLQGGAQKGILNLRGEEIQKFITGIDFALSHVTNERSNLGAMQNRLEYTIANLDIASENLSAAESRIRDADMAKEMMRLTQANVLQQAATAMLAQANQAPQSVLQLLG